MQYQVPQFIEVEDKIFGPFTLKQFIYLAGGGGVCLAFYTLLPWYLALICAAPFVALAFSLAFYKVNDRPFIVAVEHGVRYYLGNKLYLWKQREERSTPTTTTTTPERPGVTLPSMSESRLKDLSWSLNIKDRTNMGVIDPEHPNMGM